MNLGLFLVLLGLVVAVLVHFGLGAVLVIVGLFVLVWPGVPR